MKQSVLLALLFFSTAAIAQDDNCIDRIMAQEGKWVKLKETVRTTPAEYATQKKFADAFYTMVSNYKPRGVQAQWSGGFSSKANNRPVADYSNLLLALKYNCNGNELALDHETNTTLDVRYNFVSFLEVYDTVADYNSVGYFDLREGFPTEIKPGVWQFKDAKAGLGFGVEGYSRIWLFTYPGQLPWSYVTRREFLLKRKRNVQRLYADAKKQTQESIDFWETFKKQKEKEFAGDAVKMANFMSGYYTPGLAEAKAKQPKILEQYESALQRIDEQLAAPATELDKIAIVIKSQKNFLDYDFTDKMEPFAVLLTKPNPAYFKKGLGSSVPQMITVAITFDPKDPRSSNFAADIDKVLNPEYIQSFIGKTTAPAFTGTSSTPNQTVNSTDKSGTSPAPNQNTPAPKTNKQPTSKPLTPQGPLASTQSTSKPLTPQGPLASTQSTSKPLTPQGPLAAKEIFLTGTLSAPAGVPVTLIYNGSNDLTITPPKGNRNLYNSSSIKFTKPLKENENYHVLLKKIPGNMKGVVYKGSGKAPDGTDQIKIGVDYVYELITRSSDDRVFSSFYESAAPAVGGMGSEEGRYVAFVSWTKGFAGNDGKFRQVFWRDRNTGETKLISAAPNGMPADADCNLPTMSADGQLVVFESKAANLVDGDNNNKKDIFLWRAKTNTIELVSRTAGGGIGDGDSYDASLSGNGQFVVFTSDAPNMSRIAKGRSLYNIFIRDIIAGTTEMLSVDPALKTGGNGVKASISFDGKRVSFCSPSNTLVPGDNNNLWDIFLWEKEKNGLRRISFTHEGKERNQGDESGSRQVASTLSGNGRYIVYSTTATNMVPSDNAKYQDVFVFDIETGKLQVASFTDDDQPGNHDSPIEQGERIAISYDGTWVAFPTKATNLGVQSSNILLFNTQTGKKTSVTNTRGSYVSRPVISYSGSYVVFGKSEALDIRSGAAFGETGGGIFAHFTGNGPCRDCK